MDNVLLYFSLKYNGNWEQIYNALDVKEKIETQELIQIPETIPNNYISIINPIYPNSLKQILRPPFVLYYLGNPTILENYYQTIHFNSGNFNDSYNLKMAKEIIFDLIKEKRTMLFSQNTKVDEELVDFIIKNKGRLILLVNENLQNFINSEFWSKYKDIDYSEFIVLSEYETSSIFKNEKSKKESSEFIRLINGLSKTTVFLENSEWNKIEPVLNAIINENKIYFAIPQSIKESNSSSNKILKMGGKFLESAVDILNQI
ncbi:hypothetical protein CK556_03040 [Mesoplasma chauliocola]|uniref:Smf/DprA SLOG domain-containing protein n=1 Tax=Mesoplasma chauliocola TaxID=216427 RepID=A0A249SNQ7_9MOLU|nr:DNA-processing protein DprA [Mesoplasma chauliocola]ASZ09304.1 hypothetical protein CK556_03040 [Mesoplasma chauliocola]